MKNNHNVADVSLIKELLNSDISSYEIEKKLGISRMSISNFRNGKSSIDRMPLLTAIKLTNFCIDKLHKN